MSAASPPSQPARTVHWLVRMNRRNRSAFYAMLGVAIALHLPHRAPDAHPVLWTVVALQFLLYPQLAYWWARRSAHQRRTEMRNMWIDAVLGGIWSAALGLPVWLSFTLTIGNCINMVVFYGLAGLPRLALATGGGMALSAAGWLVAAGHWPLQPETDLPASLACVGALTVYFIAFAHDGYVRAMQQHRNHERLQQQFDEIQALQARLQEQALRDPLTGLFNRRQLDANLGPAIARSQQAGRALSVVMIDIDHFKHINDTYGHPAGDAVLQALAQLLQRQVRPGDMACRHGGEEFVLMLDGAPAAVARDRADALRRAFEQLVVTFDGAAVSATLSCGVASFPEHASHPQRLMACADQALYAAKTKGRNRVEAPGATPPGSASIAA